VVVSFWEYCKAGVPLTAVTLAFGVVWLRFLFY
jgi:Na+/H+ antiporter NhaD/arsenite permease-like protein